MGLGDAAAPVRRRGGVTAVPSPAAAARRRLDGTYAVDGWGLDTDIVALVRPLAALRWSVEVGGPGRVPADGPALLVANRRIGISEPWVVALGVLGATGRVPRVLGAPDAPVVGSVLRRLGAALADPVEAATLLRAGELVVAFLTSSWRDASRAGTVADEVVAPALSTGAPVVPVTAAGSELGRRWRVQVGRPVPPRRAVGPLAALELAEDARTAVQDLLDESFRPRWPFG